MQEENELQEPGWEAHDTGGTAARGEGRRQVHLSPQGAAHHLRQEPTGYFKVLSEILTGDGEREMRWDLEDERPLSFPHSVHYGLASLPLSLPNPRKADEQMA